LATGKSSVLYRARITTADGRVATTGFALVPGSAADVQDGVRMYRFKVRTRDGAELASRICLGKRAKPEQ
jgi:hypothetical protein